MQLTTTMRSPALETAMKSDVKFAISRRVLACRWNVDVTCRIHGRASGFSSKEFRLIELEQVGIYSRRSGRQLTAVEMVQRHISTLIIAIVDVIGRILFIANPTEIVRRL
jgi:hypothetical protein